MKYNIGLAGLLSLPMESHLRHYTDEIKAITIQAPEKNRRRPNAKREKRNKKLKMERKSRRINR